MERFWAKVDKIGPCWIWTAGRFATGYGCFRLQGKSLKAHRVAYELEVGPIPPGLNVLHRCDVPLCVNPAHLWVGTARENNADMLEKGRGASGERHWAAKLTRAQVEEIRAAQEPHRAIAARFGVSHNVVGRIKRGKLWL